jgi:hypothetical protein
MTKQISENSGILIRAGVLCAMVLSVSVWFHNRLTAVEMQQVEQKTDIRYIKESVDRIEKAVVK